MIISANLNGVGCSLLAVASRFLLIAMAFQLSGFGRNCLGDDISLAGDHDRDGVNFVIEGVINRIENLKSGEAVIRFLTAPNQKSMETDRDWIPGSVYRYVFNYDRDQILFEHTLPVNNGARTLKTLTTGQSRMFYEEGRSGPGSVTIKPVSWMTGILEAIPIDFRIAGLVGWGEFCMHFTFDDCKSKFWLSPGRYQKVSLDRDKTNGLAKLVLNHTDKNGADWFLVISIDESKQYVPIEVQRFFRPPPDAERPENFKLNVLSKISTKWAEKSGIWVPEEWMMERGLEPPVKLVFDWRSVNDQIDERTFGLDGMNLPKGTSIFNQLGNEAVFEGIIGESAPLMIGKSPPPRSNRYPFIIILNFVFAGIAYLIVLWRKWHPASENKN